MLETSLAHILAHRVQARQRFQADTICRRLDLHLAVRLLAPFDTMDFYKSLELSAREYGVSISATELGEGFQNALVLAILQAFEQHRKCRSPFQKPVQKARP